MSQLDCAFPAPTWTLIDSKEYHELKAENRRLRRNCEELLVKLNDRGFELNRCHTELFEADQDRTKLSNEVNSLRNRLGGVLELLGAALGGQHPTPGRTEHRAQGAERQ